MTNDKEIKKREIKIEITEGYKQYQKAVSNLQKLITLIFNSIDNLDYGLNKVITVDNLPYSINDGKSLSELELRRLAEKWALNNALKDYVAALEPGLKTTLKHLQLIELAHKSEAKRHIKSEEALNKALDDISRKSSHGGITELIDKIEKHLGKVDGAEHVKTIATLRNFITHNQSRVLIKSGEDFTLKLYRICFNYRDDDNGFKPLTKESKQDGIMPLQLQHYIEEARYIFRNENDIDLTLDVINEMAYTITVFFTDVIRKTNKKLGLDFDEDLYASEMVLKHKNGLDSFKIKIKTNVN